MLKRTTMSERVAAWARQHGLDLQVEAIAQHDTDSQRAHASTEARASAVMKQEEDLAVRACQEHAQELYASAEARASAIMK
jgi:putative aminopeptidase FrvX